MCTGTPPIELCNMIYAIRVRVRIGYPQQKKMLKKWNMNTKICGLIEFNQFNLWPILIYIYSMYIYIQYIYIYTVYIIWDNLGSPGLPVRIPGSWDDFFVDSQDPMIQQWATATCCGWATERGHTNAWVSYETWIYLDSPLWPILYLYIYR